MLSQIWKSNTMDWSFKKEYLFLFNLFGHPISILSYFVDKDKIVRLESGLICFVILAVTSNSVCLFVCDPVFVKLKAKSLD